MDKNDYNKMIATNASVIYAGNVLRIDENRDKWVHEQMLGLCVNEAFASLIAWSANEARPATKQITKELGDLVGMMALQRNVATNDYHTALLSLAESLRQKDV